MIILPSTYHATLGQNDFDRNVSEELQSYGLWKVSYKISVPATLRNYKKNHITCTQALENTNFEPVYTIIIIMYCVGSTNCYTHHE